MDKYIRSLLGDIASTNANSKVISLAIADDTLKFYNFIWKKLNDQYNTTPYDLHVEIKIPMVTPFFKGAAKKKKTCYSINNFDDGKVTTSPYIEGDGKNEPKKSSFSADDLIKCINSLCDNDSEKTKLYHVYELKDPDLVGSNENSFFLINRMRLFELFEPYKEYGLDTSAFEYPHASFRVDISREDFSKIVDILVKRKEQQ